MHDFELKKYATCQTLKQKIYSVTDSELENLQRVRSLKYNCYLSDFELVFVRCVSVLN